MCCSLRLLRSLSSLLPVLLAWGCALGAFQTPLGWSLVALHRRPLEPEAASSTPAPPELKVVVVLQRQPAQPQRPVVGLWVKGDGQDWMNQHQGGLREVWAPWSRVWCFVQDALAPRRQVVAWRQGDTVRGPPARIWDRTWESTVEPAFPPSRFFFQKNG